MVVLSSAGHLRFHPGRCRASRPCHGETDGWRGCVVGLCVFVCVGVWVCGCVCVRVCVSGCVRVPKVVCRHGIDTVLLFQGMGCGQRVCVCCAREEVKAV